MPFPPTPSNSPSNTPTPSITASNTPTLTPTGTPCPEVTATNTPTISVTPSITASNTATPSNTPTNTATPSQTPTINPTPTQTPSNTATSTPTATIGSTPTQTQTQTLTPSPTACNNVTSVFGYMEPCIGGTIDDYMGAAVFVDNAVTVDTEFVVEVFYVLPGNTCGSGESSQTFNVPMLSGSSSSSFDACSFGAYFSSGAVICSSCIVSCDNPSICIPAEFLC